MVEEISNEEMASYLNMIFNSNELNNAYCQHPKFADSIFQNIGNILAKYYISTGDNSFESAKKIIDDYLNYGSEENFFQEHFMPIIEEKIARNLSIDSNNLSLADRVKIQEHVYIRNKNNLFYTHCFPGALVEEISTNGLDISKEFFKDEYKILSTCFKTPYKTGELNYCELSDASLSYATIGMPERVHYSIGGVRNLSDTESLHDAYARSLDENLQKEYESGKIDDETMDKMRQAGTKIIDFYAKGKSGIAVFRKNREKKPKEGLISRQLINEFSFFGKELKNTSLGSIIANSIKKATSNPEQSFEIYESMFREIMHIYPDASAGISEFVNKRLVYSMSHFAISNYMYGGNANGYYVDGGKMLPNEFAIVTFATPREVVVRNQMQNKVITSNQQSPKKEKINSTLNTPSAYDDMKGDIQFLDKKFRQVIEMNTRPEMIERVDISKYQNLIVVTVDGEKKVVGNVLAAETDQGNIYYNFTGNIDIKAKEKMKDVLEENLGPEEKKKIVEQFRTFDPEYNDDYIEEDAIDWHVKQQYSNMTEDERESLKKEVLESFGKFIVFERDGSVIISPLKNDEKTQEYHGKVLYSRTFKGKYTNFFERIRSEIIQSVDELGKQVFLEMADVERQNVVQNVINSQVKELGSAEKGAR